MPASSIYKKWDARIDDGVFTKYQCQQWCHTVVPLSLHQESSGKKTNLDPDEALTLRVKLDYTEVGVLLTDEHTKYAREWLAKNWKHFPAWVQGDFGWFSFDGGAHNINVDTGRRPVYTPVWRIHGLHGETLDYSAMAWQTSKSGIIIHNGDLDYHQQQTIVTVTP